MFQRALSGSGGGNSFEKVYDGTQNPYLQDEQQIDFGFEPAAIFFYAPNYSGANAVYEVWKKDVNSNMVMQNYAGTTYWYTPSPSSYYSGIKDINGNVLTIEGSFSGITVYIYAYA